MKNTSVYNRDRVFDLVGVRSIRRVIRILQLLHTITGVQYTDSSNSALRSLKAGHQRNPAANLDSLGGHIRNKYSLYSLILLDS